MTKKIIFTLSVFSIIYLCITCSKPQYMPPILALPVNNSTCLTGVNIQNTDSSTVRFEWLKTSYAINYYLKITDIESSREIFNDTISNELSHKNITLLEKKTYQWYLTALFSDQKSTLDSEKWNFYLPKKNSDGTYIPIQPKLISPANSSKINSTSENTIELKFEINDTYTSLSNLKYSVYMGTNNSNISVIQEDKVPNTTTNIQTVSVSSSTTYYWYISLKDQNNNIATSPTYSFAIN